ncbi:MAG: hypothetical protein P1P82_03345 [Bacteroidales bacterium]|nr:hypothetical protein [Bacteroidales bacterium]MDT8432000.1 hypothetical protein [Bacteroidales bacterium]
MLTEETYFRLINYASKAPSLHNTQPWKFGREEDAILLYPDLSRSLPVVDPDNHALFISLGCTLENLVVAAGHYGFDTTVEVRRGRIDDPLRVKLSPLPPLPDGAHAKYSALFAQIKPRQVTKGTYKEDTLDRDTAGKIREIPVEPGTNVRLILPGEESEKLLPLVVEGSDRQFGNKAFVRELVDWLRFNEKEAIKKGDGIWNATMGLPATGRAIGSFIMKRLVTPRSEAKRWKKLFRKSAGFVLFSVAQHDPEHWIRLGRSFQRFGLETTAMGLKHAHMNMPLEEELVREKVSGAFDLGEMMPLLLLRIGYADPGPYSFRRNLYEMIAQQHGQA